MRPYQIVGDRADPAEDRDLDQLQAARHHRGRRLRLAHHRLGQDADQLQGGAARQPSCRASTRCCSSSTARTSTTRPCASTTASRRARPTRTPRRAVLKKQLEDPGARIIITTIQKLATFIAAEQGPRDLRRPRRDHLRRVPPLAVRRHAHRDHQGVQALQPVRLHRHADLRRQRRHAAATRSCAPPSRRSASGCTPTRSSTRSTTRTCCRSASTTSTRSRSPTDIDRQAGRRRSTPSGRCSLPSGSRQVVGYMLRALRPEDQAQLERYTLGGKRRRAASTPCSPRRRSRPPSATTAEFQSSRRSCRRTSGSRSG